MRALHGRTVGLDTVPLIYFIKEHPSYLELVRPFFLVQARGDFAVVTSTITSLEVLVQPLRQKNERLARQYRDLLLQARRLTLYPLLPIIAEGAAVLRAQYQLRTPDAIQLATALHGGATDFLTNDRRLPALPGFKLLILEDLGAQP